VKCADSKIELGFYTSGESSGSGSSRFTLWTKEPRVIYNKYNSVLNGASKPDHKD
jgi:hypothetical protein